MRARDAERAARRFVSGTPYAHWNFDLCLESVAMGHDRRSRKSWSFSLTPDEEDEDYEPGRTLTGYVHANGDIEGLY